jgi:hypothetical protein
VPKWIRVYEGAGDMCVQSDSGAITGAERAMLA